MAQVHEEITRELTIEHVTTALDRIEAWCRGIRDVLESLPEKDSIRFPLTRAGASLTESIRTADSRASATRTDDPVPLQKPKFCDPPQPLDDPQPLQKPKFCPPPQPPDDPQPLQKPKFCPPPPDPGPDGGAV